jgi:uncharacterized protein (TIGR02452 family)
MKNSSDYSMLQTPFKSDIITYAAPDLRYFAGFQSFNKESVIKLLKLILFSPKILNRDIDIIVLGAWGCGEFMNDPQVISTIFADLLLKYGDIKILYVLQFLIKQIIIYF